MIHQNFEVIWKLLIKNVCDYNFTKLNVIVPLLHIKCLNKVTIKGFDMLLDFLREVIPHWKEKLPESFYAINR